MIGLCPIEGSSKTTKLHMAPGEHSGWSPNWSGPTLPCSALPRVRHLRKNRKAFALMELHPELQHPSGLGGGQTSGLSLSPFSHDAPPGSTEIPDRPAGGHILGSIPLRWGKRCANTPGELWEEPTVTRTRGPCADAFASRVGHEGSQQAAPSAQTQHIKHGCLNS